MSHTAAKKRYKTTNWAQYNASLKARGSLTIWLDKRMTWFAATRGKRGRSPKFCFAARLCENTPEHEIQGSSHHYLGQEKRIQSDLRGRFFAEVGARCVFTQPQPKPAFCTHTIRAVAERAPIRLSLQSHAKCPLHFLQVGMAKWLFAQTCTLQETNNNDMTSQQQRAQLHRQIWAIANDVRGAVDGWDFKQYVLGTLFYRFISENFANYIEGGDDSVNYAALNDAVVNRTGFGGG